MNILILKLILTPLLIATATLAVRRWGFALGGLFTGLPLTSGPVSLFLAMEQGPGFAEKGSQGMLLGTIALTTFCVAYIRTARGLSWLPPLIVGLIAYLLAAWGLSFVSLSLVGLSIFVFFILCTAVGAAGPSSSSSSFISAPWWDIPLRMVTATVMVLLITGGAKNLGPQWSGILAPFPVFSCIMGVFAQKQNGAAAAHRLLKGIIIGSFGAVSFYIVVAFEVARTGIANTFLLATLAALAVNSVCLALLRRGKGQIEELRN